jgi:hypothetical protein
MNAKLKRPLEVLTAKNSTFRTLEAMGSSPRSSTSLSDRLGPANKPDKVFHCTVRDREWRVYKLQERARKMQSVSFIDV